MANTPPAQGTAPGAWSAASVGLVVVAADELASRRIAAALETFAVSVVGEVRSVEELVADSALRALVRRGRGAVVLACDPSRRDSLAAIRKLARELHGIGLVVVCSGSDGTGVRQALNAGADGIVNEIELEATLGPAALSVVAGHMSVPRRLHRCVFRPAFSYREKQVLAMVVRGATNGQIAARLFLVESTIKTHLGSAFQKLGVHSRKEAAALLLDPDEGLAGSLDGVELDM
jgi:DNA-binding NarL/FixJ family response regulator